MPYGAHEHMPVRCEYVTVLRHPVERVVSVYKQIVKDQRHMLHDRVMGSRIGLEEYVESGMDEGQTENSQTRQLSGRQFGVVDAAALDEAKRNLEKFRVVGLTERFRGDDCAASAGGWTQDAVLRHEERIVSVGGAEAGGGADN